MVEVASGVPNVAAGDAAALFFDVDGTIIWHRPDSDPGEVVVSGRPTEAVRSAFAELKRRGHKTFICTGRPRCLVSDALLDLEPTGLITGAGATIYIGDRIVFENPIDPELVIRAAEEFLAVGTSVVFEGPALCVSVVAAGRAYHEFPGAPTVHTVEELRAVAPDLRFDKVSFSNEELGRIDRARDFFGAHFTLCDLGVGLSEMNVIGTDKGAGVRHALEALDRPVSRTFAFGDSENDLPMLEAVEVPVAMGNALPRVKGMASYVTDSVEHDGVVSAMRHFGLI